VFRRIFATALGAGIGVGLLLAALQHVALVPLILEAERYERKDEPKKQATNSVEQRAADHAAAGAVSALVVIGHAHAHGHDAAASDESPWRAAWTTIATTLTSVGFALLLVGAFAVSGREVTARDGVLWGLAGFAAFSLAPAFGLPPELPGAVAADLWARQLWWIGTVATTALGLGLIIFGRAAWAVVLGLVVLAAPHLVGAPHSGGGAGSAPPELAAAFAARSLVVSAIFWSVLGWAAGALYARLGRVEAA
jgi:cobalt transporter subunit CbtA